MGLTRIFPCAVLVLLLVFAGLVGGCARDDIQEDNGVIDDKESGTLLFTADGEEHVREGILSKDGWAITFSHAYVTLAGMTAYQTDPPYDTNQGWDFNYLEAVELPGPYTVDLADPAADPALVGTVEGAPAGHYNALKWDMVRAPAGPAQGYVMMFVGRAEKNGQVINFTLRLEQELTYLGGEYVGDERKGILEAGGSAAVEMTFHFDHLFGRGDKAPDDPLNLIALGFDPLAALAVGGSVDVNMAALKEALSEADYALLEEILLHLGHVGEGHCLARVKS